MIWAVTVYPNGLLLDFYLKVLFRLNLGRKNDTCGSCVPHFLVPPCTDASSITLQKGATERIPTVSRTVQG